MTESPNSTGTGGVAVTVSAGRASLETLTGAVDGALASPLAGLSVTVELPASDSRRAALAALYGADPRVKLAAPGESGPAADLAIELPPRARPDFRTLPALADAVRADGLASASARVPGLAGGTVQARGGGSGSRRLRARDIGLRSGRPKPAAPPPRGTLSGERAEHLRHRARGATMRARMDRNSHRYARERLQVRHERARLRLAEERLGRSGAGAWVAWRTRGAARRLAGVPAAAAALVRSARSYGRRARRFAFDRWRSRSRLPQAGDG